MKNTGTQHPVSRKRRLCAGTTLVEVVLAAVIVAILAAIASTALFHPTRLVISDARLQVALHEANAEMERIAAMSYAEILDEPPYTLQTLNQTINIDRTIDEYFSPNEKTITVTVLDEDRELLVELITQRTP